MNANITAGWGFASHAFADEFIAALAKALAAHGLDRRAVVQVAIPAERGEGAALVAASRLRLPLISVDRDALAAARLQLLSCSARSIAATGSPSASEAAALCAAGAGAALLGPRLAFGPVTCALACAPAPM